MSRNNDGLTDRQAEFLNTLAVGRMTTEEVERHLGMACHTLRRWMDEEAFLVEWAKTNTLLQLRRGADDAVLGKGEKSAVVADGASGGGDIATRLSPSKSGDRGGEAADERRETASDRGGDSAGGGAKPQAEGRGRGGVAPKSDRDLIRLRHGEEAARAFEDLLRRHAAPVVGVPESAPPGSAPPPPSGEGGMAVQPVQGAASG